MSDITIKGISGNKRAHLGNRIHKPKKPVRILGKGFTIEADSQSLMNNNMLVVGSTGTGKSRSIVSPTLEAATTESFIVVDTKRSLYDLHRDSLIRKGYHVHVIDLVNIKSSSCGYNPFDFVRLEDGGRFAKTDDIKALIDLVVPDSEFRDSKDPYWSIAAKDTVTMTAALCCHLLPQEEHTLEYVGKILNLVGRPEFDMLISEAEKDDPECLEVKMYEAVRSTGKTERMMHSVNAVAQTVLSQYLFDDIEELYSRPDRINFEEFQRHKTALFLNISDHDDSRNPLVRLFMSQAINNLIDIADRQKEHKLRRPVHIIADDAGNYTIPGLHRKMNVFRSRQIYITILFQSIDQAKKYGVEWTSIIANCSILILLGSNELETIRYFAETANKPVEQLQMMPIQDELICFQGREARIVKKYIADDFKSIACLDDLEENLEHEAGIEKISEDLKEVC